MADVFANSRSILHKGDGNQHVAAPPDVCKTPTPGGPVPIPYPNMAMDSNLADGAKKVKINGNPVAHEGSNLSTSTGDEAGTAGGGIISSKFKGKMTWNASSTDVKVEGKGVVRFMDPTGHNNNTFNTAFISVGTTGQAYGDDEPCPLCGKKHPRLESTGAKDATRYVFDAFDRLLTAKNIANPFRAEAAVYCTREDVFNEIAVIKSKVFQLDTLLAESKGLAAQIDDQTPGKISVLKVKVEAVSAEVSKQAAEARMSKREQRADCFPDDAQVSEMQLLRVAHDLIKEAKSLQHEDATDEARAKANKASAEISAKYGGKTLTEAIPLPKIDGSSPAETKAAVPSLRALQQAFKDVVNTANKALQFVPKYAGQDPRVQIIRRALDKEVTYLEGATELDGLEVLGKMVGVVLCNSECNDHRQAVFAVSGPVGDDAKSRLAQKLKEIIDERDPTLSPRHTFETEPASLDAREERRDKTRLDEVSGPKNRTATALASAKKEGGPGDPDGSLQRAKNEAESNYKAVKGETDARRANRQSRRQPATTEAWGCAAPKMVGKLTENGHNTLYISEVFYSPIYVQGVRVPDVITVKKNGRTALEDLHLQKASKASTMSETADTITITPQAEEHYSEFVHGETVPSCSKCQKNLPAYFCEKDAHCCA